MGNTKTKLMNFRNTTLALTLAATSSAIKLNSSNVFDDIGDAFDDAYDWSKGAVNDAGEWMEGAANDAVDWMEGAANDAYDWSEGAADDIADFAKDNQDFLIDTGEALSPIALFLPRAIYNANRFGDEFDIIELVEEGEEEELLDALYDTAIDLGADIGTEVAEMSTEELIEMAILAAAA